jgi:xylulokinase
MSYLGLDVGTSRCKAVLFEADGAQLGMAFREYPVKAPQENWAELDSRQVVEACMNVIREAAASHRGDPVRGIGISSQGEAFTAIGRKGEFFTNAMVSSDSRAARLSKEWSEGFGRMRLYEKTGHTPSPMFTLFKLIWLRDAQPQIWANTEAFYCFEDLIQQRLGLDPAISWCLAGRTMLFNVRDHTWDREILDKLGLEASKLARPIPSGAVAGTILSSVARELNLPDGVQVVAGGHDQCCGALGAGVASPGRAVYAAGTVDCITPAFSEPVFSLTLFENNLATYNFTVPGMYTTVAYSLTGGSILTWFRDVWGACELAEAARTGASPFQLLLEQIGNAPSGLLVLPYWTPSGTPYFDSRVKGAILGLRMTTTRAQVLRALLEGVAFEMRLNMNILEQCGIHIEELVAIGGGAQNLAWLQLKADVLGKPVSRATVTEAGCLGVAMLAMAADTDASVVDIANEWAKVTEVVEPQPQNSAFYDDQFGTYLDLYKTLKPLYGKEKLT